MSKISELEKATIIISLNNEINSKQKTLNELESKENPEHMDKFIIKIKKEEIARLENLIKTFSKSKMLWIPDNFVKTKK